MSLRRKLLQKASGMIFTCLLLIAAVQTSVVYAATTQSYDFSDMTYGSSWGVTYSISEGAATFQFSGQYREIKFLLPQTLELSQCTNVTFRASSPDGAIAFKLYDTDGNEAAVKYDFNASISDCSFTPDSTAQISSIGIMAQEIMSYSATVYSVDFTMVDSSSDSTTLLNTYGAVLSNSGAAVNSSQLKDSTTLNTIKSQYNSITMENEMKPDALLGSSTTLLTLEQAEENGYYISSGYTESVVPTLDFDTVDEVLKICYNNNLKLRAHTLIWHSQTPDWFFREGYSESGSYVTESVMDARMEFYIKTIMYHVYLGDYGSVVYAWDVVNEYLHASWSGWSQIYGTDLGTSPAYVKKAFQYANDCLSYFGITDSVSLFYNDYNTYQVTDDIISLIHFINSNNELCNGVGMQSHLSTSYPTVTAYKAAMQAFLDEGFEVQITELDVQNTSSSQQANYVYKLFSAILNLKQAGGEITGVTWWGLYDSVSWKASSNPLLFSDLSTPKTSYYSVLQAYTDAGYEVQ